MERLELVVIGAGWYGLAAAKQYHEQHPDQPMAVLDYASSVGGVWAEHRLYPGLKSNNLLGTYEYPDFPMDPAVFGVQPGQHPPGAVIHAYHEAYAKKFGIWDLIRCGTKVVSADHQEDGGWILTVCPVSNSDPSDVQGSESKIFTRRLVVATGLTSEPFMPHIEGQETFGKPLFHSKDFLKNADTIDPEKTKRATVFGGTKFAWDAVYAYGKKGIKVDWIIRASGHGSCWMSPPYVTPLKKWLEKLVNVRLLTWFAPCIWSADGGYSGIRSFYHNTAIGRAITNTFWSILGNDVIQLNGFDKHPEMAKLKPWNPAMFTGCSFSILNYETDFFELIRDGTVKIHIADLDHLSPGKVHLADEDQTVLESDAMLCVTGWKHIPPFKLLPEGIDKKIGLPHLRSEDHASLPADEDLACQQDLFDKADAEILQRFPRLADSPKFNDRYVPLASQKAFSVEGSDKITPTSPVTPFMLYHFIVPASATFLRTKDIAFAGVCMNFSNAISAHLQGLWISAYFDGKLKRDPSMAVAGENGAKVDGDDHDHSTMTLERLQYETVLFNRFGKWRYPNDYGSMHPDFVFEAVPYLDLLVADLGLNVHRKGGWFKEMTDPYGPEDYADVNDEWRSKFGGQNAS